MVVASRFLIAVASWLAVAGAAHAQTAWAPGRTVRLVIPFPPGGASDILARLLANHVSSSSGQGIVIENRPGGGTE